MDGLLATMRRRILPLVRRRGLALDGDRALALIGKAIPPDCTNVTVGFSSPAEVTDKSVRSLMRMLGPGGNPFPVALSAGMPSFVLEI